MYDGEQRYDRHSALLVARELDEMGFAWLEAPLRDQDLDGYRDLRRNGRACRSCRPGTRSSASSSSARPCATTRGTPCASTSPSPAASRRRASSRRLAEAWGLRVELQSWGYTLIQAANLHFGLANEHSGYFELPVPHESYEFGVENPYAIQPDGYVDAPTAPGLGVVVDWERMEHARLSSFTCTTSVPEVA